MNKTKIWPFLQDYGGILTLIVAVVATLGSLYFSEVAGFVPCTLCWYQRILMYPLTFITLVGIIKQDEDLPAYVLPLSLVGMSVSGYHILIQYGVFSHPATCTVGVPCSLRYINYLGFITIPLLAFTAFTLITIVMLATRRAFSHESWDDYNDVGDDSTGSAASVSRAAPYKWGAPLGGTLLLIILVTLVASFGGASPVPNPRPVENPTGPGSGEALFQQVTLGNAPGCIACHSLEPDVVIVGPSVAGIGRLAQERIPGRPAGAYLRQSIVDPDAYVVGDFTAGVMYQNYGEVLSEDQIDALVSYLLTLE